MVVLNLIYQKQKTKKKKGNILGENKIISGSLFWLMKMMVNWRIHRQIRINQLILTMI